MEAKVNSTEAFGAVLKRISFINSVVDFEWRFQFEEVEVRSASRDRKGWLLWAEFSRPDTHTGEIGIGRGREEIVWSGATESAVIKTAWVIVELLVRHELMEGFCVDSKKPFDPHHTIETLNSLRHSEEDAYSLKKED